MRCADYSNLLQFILDFWHGFLQIAAGGDPGWLRYLSILVEGPWISRSRTFCACFGVVIGGPCLALRGAEGERGAF